jgi:DGQHR domain-containing protein
MKGKVVEIDGKIGYIECSSDSKRYFFSRVDSSGHIAPIKKNDIVQFELRLNKHIKGSHAYNIVILKEEKEPSTDSLKIVEPKQSLHKIKSKYNFIDFDDLLAGSTHIVEKLNYQYTKAASSYQDHNMISESIKTLLTSAKNLTEIGFFYSDEFTIEQINNASIQCPIVDDIEINTWKRSFDLQEFGNEVEIVSSIETDKGIRRDFSIVWNEWSDKKKQIFSNGYNKGHFNYSNISRGEKEQTSIYTEPPPPAKWKLHKVEQKGYSFYISSAPVNVIAQSSSVPSLPPSLGIIETAERILDRNRCRSEWQREINATRIRKISQFIGEDDNIIPNTPMLYIHDDSAVEITDDTLTIHFDRFLKMQDNGPHKGSYADRKRRLAKDEFGNIIYDDFRPMWIIDGQHRIKGINRNQEEQGITVPIVIFPKEFKISNTAKIFAEINTLQTKLNPLHELFMQHRFSIDHVNIKRKFRDFRVTSYEDANKEAWTSDWVHSRANHLAYEILAKLAKDGPLKNRIQFLPQNGNSSDKYVTADQWVNYARTWFVNRCYKYKTDLIEDYIFHPTEKEKMMTVENLFYEEIKNYFIAWEKICNHGEWSDGLERWVESNWGKGLIQRKTHFVILIELYPLVNKLTMTKKQKYRKGGMIEVGDFIDILKPFKWVDWRSERIKNTYPGSGEKGRRSLEVWMADALLHGKQYSQTEIINLKMISLPGRGITSRLGKPDIEIVSKNQWPTKTSPVIFRSKRPYNARYDLKWQVQDKNGDIRDEGKGTTFKYTSPSYAKFKLDYRKYLDEENIDSLTVRVDWSNSLTITGQNSIKIRK